MNKNIVVAMIFSFGILLGWDYFVMRPQREAMRAAAVMPGPSSIASSPGASSPSASSPSYPSSVPTAPVVKRVVEYEVGTNRISFNAQGAGIDQWWIREKDRWDPVVVEITSERPLVTFPELQFEIKRQGEQEFVFTAARTDGLQIKKTYRIAKDGHVHNITMELRNGGSAPLDAGYSIGWGLGIESGDVNPKERLETQRAIALEGPRLWKFKAGNHEGHYSWWGVDARYFLAAFLNDKKEKLQLTVHKVDKLYSVQKLSSVPLAPGASQTESLRMYVGPKGYSQLMQLGLNLERAVDFGFFATIGQWVLRSLYFLNNMTHNYGWSILILTIAIQILVIPLTVKSFTHGQRMKALQPQMKKLQTLYKSDPKRLNTEMLHLYQKNGLRFMGMEGCFPMLIQLPIFWALYTTLRNAFELRGAPWILWIHDLSLADPYYVLPVIMGLGMFLQQKMSAVSLDPMQAKMMYILPVMMTFIFLKMPSGLVLYWCTNSLVAIIVQAILLKRHEAGEPAIA